MAKKDELSSTEKLLELIRDEAPAGAPAADSGTPQPLGGRIRNLLSNSISISKKSISVGVDLGREDVKLVMLNRVSERKTEVLDYARVPLNPEIPKDHPEFHRFIRSTLVTFCGPHRNIKLWATISSARVENRHIKIPKVPPKQVANSVFWTYQRLSAFNAQETIFDFDVLGEIEEAGARKISVMAFIAPRQEVENLRGLFARAGFALTGISIVPFAFQTLLRTGRIKSYGAAVSTLYIGRDWSRIDIFSGDSLVLSRGIKAGIRTMTDALQKEIEQNWFELSLAKSPTSDLNRIQAIKQRLKQELEAAHNVFFGPIHAEAGSGSEDKQLAVREERIFQMIRPALERLVRQIERTIRHFALNFDNTRVEKIYVSSGVRPHPRILDYISKELGLPVEIISPFADGDDLVTLRELPGSRPEQSAFAPAMGMAMATNPATPNFLFTHKDKGAVSNTQRINRGICAACAAGVLLCIGTAFWQERQIQARDTQKLGLQAQLSAFQVRVDRNLILKLLDQIRAQNKNVQGISNSYLGVGVLGEVANVTPPNIRLLGISAKLGAAGKPAAGAKPEPPKRVLVLDGLITGDRMSLESDLAGYLMALKSSPLFKQPTITRKAVEVLDNRQVMRFTAQMELV
ncbi:MAG TPA: pilus assembly protein PilM [Desulfobacterales bacterium]|nr:pilus assembly protein PilM [Desulfobacterales bacterium]